MIDADLAVLDAAELLTVPGPAPKTGRDLREPGILSGGCLAARAGTIVFVGDREAYRRTVRLARHGIEISAAGRTVLPGFVDAHTHLPFAGSREQEMVQRLRGATYESIMRAGGGIMATVRATREASLENLVALGRRRLDRMLLHGTTTVEAKSGYGLTLDDELKQLRALQQLDRIHPIDLVPTFLGAHVVPAERRADRAGYIREVIDRMIPRVAAEGLARFCDVFIDEGAFTAAEGEAILQAGAGRGLRPRLHAEQRSASGGAALAARLRAASADHLEHAGEEDIAALAAAGTTAILLPGAAFFLRDPRDPPARRLIDGGVAVALASDFNPGTCPSEALSAILPIACLRLGLEPAEAIAAATLNAAHSLGLAERAGSLEVGKRADLQVLDVPNHVHLAYHFGINHCRTVVKGGRVVVDEGILAGSPVDAAGSGG
jgi:imidazolonepropionase